MLRALKRLLTVPLVGLVRLYQIVMRPLLPPLCRFYPSCSDYALEALQVHGPARGSWLAVRRVCKCHPFHPGGVDLVPPAVTPESAARTAASTPR